MKNISIGLLVCFQLCFNRQTSAQLKSIVYDFEGQDIGQTDLPEGDYHTFDMQYQVDLNPLGPGQMLGDRVLKLTMNWISGTAQFGKGISRFVELDPVKDRFNFYVYNPASNTSDSKLKIRINEDDDANHTWENSNDDMWEYPLTIPRSPNWQLISIPLSSFTDINGGGNKIFDAAFTNNAGKVFNIEFNFTKTNLHDIKSIMYIDMICFSEGILPTGATNLDLPPGNPSGTCFLGAFLSNANPQTTAPEIERMFALNPAKKLKYVNCFIGFSDNGTAVANKLPGAEITQVLEGGCIPIITWEPLYTHLARLDPDQPNLTDFMQGQFDSYIDAFGDKLKSYNDTVIVRFMHEFDGDWYPWSLAVNGGNPQLYKNVFRRVVDRIRARGASKVKWMWCVNGQTSQPALAYNWIVGAYPGNSYVDIVACEAYNISVPGVPYWCSFRSSMAEPYYYLGKYFPTKPIFICENGCRERYASEMASSETKAQWIAKMDIELQSNFKNVKALIFFDVKKTHDYKINSSPQSLKSLSVNMWNDPYYFKKIVSPVLAIPIITVIGPSELNKDEQTILYTLPDSSAVYQWSRNDSVLITSEKHTLDVNRAGLYQVKVMKNKSVSWSAYTQITGQKIQQTAYFDTLYNKELNKEFAIMKVYPNPSNGMFSLSLCLENSLNKIHISIYDPLGKMFLEKEIIPVNGSILEQIELGNEAANGIYSLNVTIGSRKESIRILLAKE